jgi:hypothetical protein
MKTLAVSLVASLALLAVAAVVVAQGILGLTSTAFTGGSGTSSDSRFVVNGTIGQYANTTMSGGTFSLSGEFSVSAADNVFLPLVTK